MISELAFKLVLAITFLAGIALSEVVADQPSARGLRGLVTFYASFDKSTTADFGKGDLTLWTRYGNPGKGNTFVQHQVESDLIRIAPGGGVSGGGLEFVDVVPNDGFVFFPAEGKLGVKPGGWGGAMSMWLNGDLTKLKTEYCDPMQIIYRRYNNGAVWTDFTPDRPRDLRLGLFSTLPKGQTAREAPEAQLPIARAKAPMIEPGKWHNLVLVWQNFDSGKPNASARLYLDGRQIAALENKNADMNWDLSQARIFLGAALIGRIDEVAIFSRTLIVDEVGLIANDPAMLAGLK